MMRSRPRPPLARMVPLCAALLAGGCAVLPADVGRFGQATVSLTTRFAPLAGRAAALCRERLVLRDVAGADRFDAERIVATAGQACSSVAAAERRLINDAGVLLAYGRQLAGQDSDIVDPALDELGTLGRIGQGVADAAGGTLTAVVRLARVLQDGARADARRRLTAQAVHDAHEPLAAFVEQLRAHARDTVAPAVDEAIALRRQLLRDLLVPASAGAGSDVARRWPLRIAQVDLLREIEQLQAERRQLEAFDAAAASLVDAHASLRDSFDAPRAPARAEAVREFVDRLRQLHDAASGV
jgi:hypothetical protein